MVARPAPVGDLPGEPSGDGIGEDVFDCCLEMRFGRHERVLEPLSEDVASPAVPAVELSCVDAVQRLHSPRDTRFVCGTDDDEEVIVRVEQAPRDNLPPDTLRHLAQPSDERKPVELSEEDRLVVDSVCREMGGHA